MWYKTNVADIYEIKEFFFPNKPIHEIDLIRLNNLILPDDRTRYYPVGGGEQYYVIPVVVIHALVFNLWLHFTTGEYHTNPEFTINTFKKKVESYLRTMKAYKPYAPPCLHPMETIELSKNLTARDYFYYDILALSLQYIEEDSIYTNEDWFYNIKRLSSLHNHPNSEIDDEGNAGGGGGSIIVTPPFVIPPALPDLSGQYPIIRSDFTIGLETLGTNRKVVFGADNVELIDDPNAPTDIIMRIKYENDSFGDGAGAFGGAKFTTEVPEADAYVFSFEVRFPTGFNYMKGGKLIGIYGGDKASNSYWSTDTVWGEFGGGAVNINLPTSDVPIVLEANDWNYPANTWVKITTAIRLNTPEKADGNIAVFINDILVGVTEKFNFRREADVFIEGIIVNSFFGGNDATYATPVDTYVDFRNITLYTYDVLDPDYGEEDESDSDEET